MAAFFIFPAAAARSDDEAVDAALKGLAGRYQGLNSFTARYTRVTTTPSTDTIFKNQASQTARGVITWLAESRLRLDQAEPDVQMMTTDGETVWWHIPDEKLVYVYRDLDLAGELAPLLSFMAGLEALKDRFQIAEAEADDVRQEQTGLVLTPKQPSGEAGGELIVYCDGAGKLTGFRLSSPTGEKTDFFLDGQTDNPGAKPSFFVFKPPRGSRVVEETSE
ncbi:MAG: outer membrane lipoprotein carrier protein LolA [Deltaproteobacteria bacterium]|nr:outer membrane lipoprotein carrier protein LolA [Deltaproteobacteria bacterium]